MKINFDKKKITEAASGMIQKTVEAGKKVAIDTQKIATAIKRNYPI